MFFAILSNVSPNDQGTRQSEIVKDAQNDPEKIKDNNIK